MTTELTIYQDIPDKLSAMTQIGNAIAKSQMFGCTNSEQGQILALECMSRGMPPLAMAERYHLIQGKLAMKADAMLAAFEKVGGSWEIKEYSPLATEIVFTRGKNVLPVRITWEDAQQEPWPWGKDDPKTKEKVLKSNWASPIGRQDLLWARVVSRGVRRLAPSVVCGAYTPEEIDDFIEGEIVTPKAIQPVTATSVPKPKTKSAAVDQQTVSPQSEEVAEEAEFTTVAEDSEPEAGPGKTTMKPAEEPCSEQVQQRIKEVLNQIAERDPEVKNRVKEKLVNCGLQKIVDMTQVEAETLLKALEIKNLGLWLDHPVIGHQKANDPN